MRDNDEMQPAAITSATCFYCGKIRVSIGSDVQTDNDGSSDSVVDLRPCSRCKEWMKQGIILITFDPVKSHKDWQTRGKFPSPYRSGGFYVMTADWVLKNFNAEAAEVALKNRWMYIEDEAVEKLGLNKKKGDNNA